MSQTGPAPRRKIICIGIIIALLAAMYPLQGSIEATRLRHDLASSNPLASAHDLPPGEFFGTVLLGGFRAIAVDLIWLKAKEAERNHDWHRYLVLNQLIASLQPRFIEVWSFNMWNMAYNLSLTAPTDREGWHWVKKAIESGKEGFERNERNPNRWKLAWHIGYHYFHRCGSIRDNRTEKYQKWLFEETGQTNWQHALYWFAKANEVGGDHANPNWLGMVSATHRKIAYEAEEKGDLEAMKQNRLHAIAWLERIRKKYPNNPSFARYAPQEIKDLRSRLKAHEQERLAEEFRKQDKTAEEFQLLREAASYWMDAYKGNPYVGEQQRHLENIAARFEEMSPQIGGKMNSDVEALHLDIWLRLIAGPEYNDDYVKKCEELDVEYMARFRDAIAAKDNGRAIAELDNVLRLRRQLYSKDPLLEKRVNSMHEIAGICEKLAGRLTGGEKETVFTAARSLWYDLFDFGHKEGAERGAALLKDRIEAIREKIGAEGDEQSELLRQEAVELVSLLYRNSIDRQWAETVLRDFGEYYTQAFVDAAGRDDRKAMADCHRRSTKIWERIRRRYPDDPQAKDSLNRMDEAYTITVEKRSLRLSDHKFQ